MANLRLVSGEHRDAVEQILAAQLRARNAFHRVGINPKNLPPGVYARAIREVAREIVEAEQAMLKGTSRDHPRDVWEAGGMSDQPRPAGARIPTPSEYYGSESYRFHNGMRVLLNIDAAEFPGPVEDWASFRDNPWRYFIGCNDHVAHALWEIIKRRNDDSQRRILASIEQRQ